MPTKRCAIEGCPGRVEALGWCGMHYHRWRTHGDPLKVAPSGPGWAHDDAPLRALIATGTPPHMWPAPWGLGRPLFGKENQNPS